MAEEALTAVLAAIADPTRRALVARLSKGEATVGELAEPFPTSLAAISKHLAVLERAGLVKRARAGQRRPCRLEPRALDAIEAWIAKVRPAGRRSAR